MRAGQGLFDFTSAVLLGMREVSNTHKLNSVLMHGDNTTAYAAATAAFYAQIPVGHVEAGLRTHNILLSPFPEEFNRKWSGRSQNGTLPQPNRAAEIL